MTTSCNSNMQRLMHQEISEQFKVVDSYHTSIYLCMLHGKLQGFFMDFDFLKSICY